MTWWTWDGCRALRYGARCELQFRTVSTKKEIVKRSEVSWLLKTLSLYRGKSQRKENCFNKTLLVSQSRTAASCPGRRRGGSSCSSRSSFLVSLLTGRKDSQFLDTYLRIASRWAFSFRKPEFYLDQSDFSDPMIPIERLGFHSTGSVTLSTLSVAAI